MAAPAPAQEGQRIGAKSVDSPSCNTSVLRSRSPYPWLHLHLHRKGKELELTDPKRETEEGRDEEPNAKFGGPARGRKKWGEDMG
jgi:hypothetical protein